MPHRPEGLAGLQPLYQAVAHGCQAGLWQEACDEVYIDRILRGTGNDDFYSSKKLGAFGANLGAVSCFFVEPWRHVRPQALPENPDRAWLLNEAAFYLRALGRLAEALEPMRIGAEMRMEAGGLEERGHQLRKLSEIQLTLGQDPEAMSGRPAVRGIC